MVESGVRFIVTTTDGVYITPTVTKDSQQGTIVILDMSDLSGPTKRVIESSIVESIVKETYEQEDVTADIAPALTLA